MTTLYRCPGTCNGVTAKEGVSCGDPECNLHDVPLVAVTQCDACAAASTEDEKPHACDGCQAC